ncbi:hypothetical protein FGO68_gene12897 [Halteria grandinella]|uniref:Transmembrane protein n=1 Tax=Halteria grandinella TaxID=5974 RepID=A0A8J8NEB0_HALGN|nr:hypothetical protein FGO68_gene12897 [Halteria grandinella]
MFCFKIYNYATFIQIYIHHSNLNQNHFDHHYQYSTKKTFHSQIQNNKMVFVSQQEQIILLQFYILHICCSLIFNKNCYLRARFKKYEATIYSITNENANQYYWPCHCLFIRNETATLIIVFIVIQ